MDPDSNSSGAPAAIRRGVEALRSAADARDFDAVFREAEQLAAGMPTEAAARSWVSVAEHWAADDAATVAGAWARAAEVAWADPVVFDGLSAAIEDGSPGRAAFDAVRAEKTGDRRGMLRVLDARFREGIAAGRVDLGTFEELCRLAVAETGDADVVLGYVDDAWAVADRVALLAAADRAIEPRMLRAHQASYLAELAAGFAESAPEHAARVRPLLLSLARSAGDWGMLHQALGAAANDASGSARAALLIERADLEMDRLGRPDLAAGSLAEAVDGPLGAGEAEALAERLERVARHPSAAALAAPALVALRERAGNSSDRARAQMLLGASAAGAPDAAEAYARAGRLFEQAGDSGAALDAWRRANAAAPSQQAADALARLLAATGRHDEAIDVLSRELGEARGERRTSLVLHRVEALLRADRADEALVDAFDAFDTAGGERAHDLLDRVLSQVDAPSVISAATRVAAARGSDAAARLYWRAALGLGLTDPEAVELALRAAESSRLDPASSARLLTALADDPERSARFQRAVLEHAESADEARRARLALGRLLASDSPVEARAHLEDVLRTDPDDVEAHDGILGIVRRSGVVTDVVEVLERRLASLTLDQDEAAAVLAELAEAYEVDLGRGDLAFDAARRLLQIEPTHAAGLRVVREFTATSGDLQLRHDVLAETLDEIDADSARSERLVELAAVAQDLGLRREAVAYLTEAAGLVGCGANEREAAGRKAFDLAMAESDAEAAARAARAFVRALDGDARAEAAEEAVDRLVAASAEAALSVATAALDGWDAPTAGVWDRHAQLARASDQPEAALASLRAWVARDGAAVPVDRRAQYAALAIRLAPGATEGWDAATNVLLDDPDQYDLVLEIDAHRDDDASLARLARNLLDATEDRSDEGAIGVLHRAADLAATARPDLAEAAWRRIVEIDPGEARAAESLRGVYRDAGDDDAEAELLARLAASAEGDLKLSYLRELAGLARSDDDLESRHLAVLEEDISDVPSRLELARLYERTGRAERAAELLEEAAPFASAVEARSCLVWAARLHAEALGAPEQAARCYEAIVSADPTDLAALRHLSEDYRAREAWADAVRVTEHLAGVVGDSEQQARLLEAAAELRETRLGDTSGAVAALERVMLLEPANLTVLQEIARLHERAENWDAYVDTLDRIAAAAPIPELRREIQLRAAPVLAEKLDRARDAFDVLTGAFDAQLPDDAELELLSMVAGKADRWVEYSAIVRRVADAEEDAQRRERLDLEIASALSERAGEPLAAVRWLADRVAAAPNPGPHLDRLESIAAAHGLEGHLVETYKALAGAHADDSEVLWHALERSAHIAERVVGHPEVAFGIMQHASETPALRERAEAAMQRIANEHGVWELFRDYLTEGGADDPTEAAVRRAAVELQQLGDWKAAFETLLQAFHDAPFDGRVREPLFELADAHAAWPFVAKILELAQAAATASDRPALVREIAAVYGDRMGQHDDAFAQALRAWQMVPEDEAARADLEARADRARRHVDLLAAYEWHARNATGHAARGALERATELAVRLEMPQRAVALIARDSELEGADGVGLVDRAVDAFGPDSAQPEFAIEVARAIGRARGREGTRVGALLRGADVAASMGLTADRIDCLREAVEAATDKAAVRPRLIEALRDIEAPAALARELEAHADEVADQGERDAVLEELLRLYRGDAPDAVRAVATARRLLDVAPHQAARRDAYVDTLAAFERWVDVVDFHLRFADETSDGDAARAARIEAARVAEECLDDPRRAARIAEAILESEPMDRTALELRARALAGQGRWKEHVEALEQLADVVAPHEAAPVYAQAAVVFETHLVYSDRAHDMWQRAADADPGFGRAWAELARLAGEAGDVEAAFEHWQLAVDAYADDPAARSLALTNLAAYARAAAPDFDVVGALGAALEADPDNTAARAALEDALAETGDVDAILALYDDDYERASSDAERAVILCRRALVLAVDAGSDSDALKAFERAIALGAGRGAHAVGGDVHLLAGRWDEAAERYELAFGQDDALDPDSMLPPRPIMAGETVDRTAPSVVYMTRAGYAHEAAGRIGRAQDYYAGANLEDETYAPALVGLARLSLRRGNPDGAAIYVSAYRATGPHDRELDEQMADIEIAAARR